MSRPRVHVAHASDPAANDLFARALVAWRQYLCGLHGHHALLHVEPGRLSLRCATCDHESPGWDLSATPAARPIASAPRPERLPQRLWLTGARKV